MQFVFHRHLIKVVMISIWERLRMMDGGIRSGLLLAGRGNRHQVGLNSGMVGEQ